MTPTIRRAARLPTLGHRLALLPLLMFFWVAPQACRAQADVKPDTPAASAPQATPRIRPVPSLTNSSDAQRSMDLNNEQAGGKVVPQVNIPLGRKAGPPVFERRKPAAAAAGASGPVIDDAAARCESEADRQSRASCRSRLGKS